MYREIKNREHETPRGLTPAQDIPTKGSDTILKELQTRNLKLETHHSGMALLTTVLFVFTLSIMGATFLALMQFDLHDFDVLRAESEARYVSEAGVHKALWYLNNFTYGEAYLTAPREESLTPENPASAYTILPIVTFTDPFPLTVTAKSAALTVETSVMVWHDRPGTPEPDFRIAQGTWKHRFVKEP